MKTLSKIILIITLIFTITINLYAQCGPYGGNRYEIQTSAGDPYLAFTVGTGACGGAGSLTFPGMGVNVTAPTYMLDVYCPSGANQDINISGVSGNVGYRIGGAHVLWFNNSSTNIYVGINAGSALSTGIYNTFVGNGAGNLIAAGQGNTALGYLALI